MDTKWRNSNIIRITRFLLFFLVIGSLSAAVIMGRDFIMKHENNIEIVFEPNFMNNDKYYSDRGQLFNDLTSLVSIYKNEQYIKDGRAVTMDDVLNHEIPPYYSEFRDSEAYNYDKSEEENFEAFKKLYPKEVELAKKDIIKTQLQTFNNINNRIAKHENINFYSTNGKDVYSNNPALKEEDYLKKPGYYMYDYNNGFRAYPRDKSHSSYYMEYNEREINPSSDTKIYIGFEQKYFDKLEQNWGIEKTKAMDSFYRFLIPFVIMLVGFIAEIVLLPSREEEGKERLLDKTYTDIAILICISLIFIYISFLEGNGYTSSGLLGTVTAGIALFGLYFILSIVRNIKNKRFFRHSLIGKILKAIKTFFVGIYNGNSFEKKIAILVILYPILVATTVFFAPLTIAVVGWIAFKKAKEFTKIKEGVKKVKNGDLSHKIDIDKNGEFKDLAEDINSISEGLDQAIDNELRSERHKAELITNVSHDIRTPLTSIITYIDLLKNETDEEKREEYLRVLESKSERLKSLTDDLFEASKVSSGNIPVNLTKIDLVSLLTQGLGELNDKIEENNLEFVIKNEFEEMNIKADGDLLWRAIENLLSNIFKYSLKGSRIYVDIEEKEDNISMTIKNISAYKLNITAEELMERFKRGDESRSSEGSGLGLSIAESLIEIQDGSFKLEIDGDLFKTVLLLPKFK